MSRFGYMPLVVYEVTASPMGEACSFRAYEWRTTDLRAVSRLLGATVMDLDEHHERARAADRVCCPFCRRAGDAVPLRSGATRADDRGDPHPWLPVRLVDVGGGVAPQPRLPLGEIPSMVSGTAVHAA